MGANGDKIITVYWINVIGQSGWFDAIFIFIQCHGFDGHMNTYIIKLPRLIPSAIALTWKTTEYKNAIASLVE